MASRATAPAASAEGTPQSSPTGWHATVEALAYWDDHTTAGGRTGRQGHVSAEDDDNDEVHAGGDRAPAPAEDTSAPVEPAPHTPPEPATAGSPMPEGPPSPTVGAGGGGTPPWLAPPPPGVPWAGGAGSYWERGPEPPPGAPPYPYATPPPPFGTPPPYPPGAFAHGAPPPPPGTSPYPYGVPPYPYPVPPYTYAPPPHPYGEPRPIRIGIFVVIAVVLIAVAAAAGAGVEYALDHNTHGAVASAAAGVAGKVDPAIVDISTTLAQGAGAATGMVLTSSGLVLTNNHVVENATSVNAQVVDTGRVYSATVLGYSVTDDVALLQLRGASGLKTITTTSSSDLPVGTPVVAIGNAGGTGGTPTAAAGAITAIDQTITAGGDGTLSETLQGMIQVNATIVPGDSGGPLVNTAGHVIGMDTAASVSGSGFGAQSGGGQGFAIAIGNALTIADQIKAKAASATVHIGPRAVMGVEVNDVPQAAGAYVESVEPGSPAAAAGISAGDAIVSVDGTTVSSAADLGTVLGSEKPGASVTVGWVGSAGARHSASLHLIVGPPA